MADLSSYINIAANTVTTANLSATGNVVSNSVISTTGNITGDTGVFNNGLSVTGNITASGNLNYQNVNDLVVGPVKILGAQLDRQAVVEHVRPVFQQARRQQPLLRVDVMRRHPIPRA